VRNLVSQVSKSFLKAGELTRRQKLTIPRDGGYKSKYKTGREQNKMSVI
jgi:hypothetical protein